MTHLYILALIGALCAGAGGTGFFVGRNNGLEDCRVYKRDVEAQMGALKDKTDKALRESERISAESGQTWAAAADYWRGNPRVIRVRENNCGQAGLSSVPVTPFGLNGRAAEPRPDPGADAAIEARECETRLNAAIFDGAQLMYLQHWVRQQAGVKP